MDGPGAGFSVSNTIKHHGVKGQKWGVRRDRGHEGQQASTRKIAKLDRKFERRTRQPFHQQNMQADIHNAAAATMNGPNGHLAKINGQAWVKKGVADNQFLRDTPTRRKYDQAVKDAYFGELEKAAKALGTNASGTQRYTIVEDRAGNWQIGITDVKHADDAPFFLVNVIRDGKGLVTKIEIPAPMSMAQSDLDARAEAALEHFGVKGMHWGVRRSKNPTHSPTSDDAKRAAKTRAKIQKHGRNAVSNKDLKDLVNRMNLEKQHSDLNKNNLTKGHEAAKQVLAIGGTAAGLFALANSPMVKAVRSALASNLARARAASAATKVAKAGSALVVGG